MPPTLPDSERPAAAGRAVRRAGPRLLPRLRQRDDVAAAAQRDREAPFERAWWRAYQEVNRSSRSGRVSAADEHPDAIAWVHDYHLTLVPRAYPRPRAGPADRVLPARAVAVAGHLRPAAVAGAGADGPARRGRGRVPHRRLPRQLPALVRPPARRRRHRGARRRRWCCPTAGAVTTATAPDLHRRGGVRRAAPRPPTVEQGIEALREQFARPHPAARRRPARLHQGHHRAAARGGDAARANPELRTSLAFLQLAVPSRDDVREYRQLRGTVEQHVGRINGLYTEPGSDVPVHYLYRGCRRSSSPRTTRSPTRCSSRR